MRRYTLVVATIWLFVLGVAEGCSDGTVGTPATHYQHTVPTPTPNDEPQQPTILMFWHAVPLADQHLLVQLIEQYNQRQSNVQVVLHAMPRATLISELQAATQTGGGPHLIALQNHTIGDLAQHQVVLPLEQLLPPETVNALLPVTVAGATITTTDGNHVYGIPIMFDTLALYYNRTIVPEPPATMETLVAMAHAITESTVQPPLWGFAYTLSFDKTIGYLAAFHGRIVNEQQQLVLGTTSKYATERWLQWLLDLHHDTNILATSDSITVDSAINAQKVAMTIDWSYALPNYHTLWGEQLGVALLPSLQETGASPAPYVQSMIVSVNAHVGTLNAHTQHAARDVLQYLVSEEAQQLLLLAGKQPTRSTLDLHGETPVFTIARLFRQQANSGQPMPNSRIMNDIVRDELVRMQTSVLRGLVIPSEAVVRTDNILHERLQEEHGFAP